ncbi:hypothetical protein Q2V69_22665, partial [Escherichia coli]|nr:hypothetical protein [Escherichia coli]
MNLLFHTLLFCFFYLTCFIPNFIRLKIKCAAGYNFAFRYFRTSYLPRIIPRFTDAPLILAKDLSMAGNVQEKLNRPGFPGECFICELRLPDHRFRWKHNKLFLLLPEEYGPAFPA